MRIDVVFTPNQLNEKEFRDKIVVVIDVLRASTTICMALHNGAKKIIPVDDVEQALKLQSNLFESVPLLCGERGGKIIPGFDLGNSPLEYTEDKISDRTLIFASTNGSAALVKSKQAKLGFVCGFVNLSPIVKFLNHQPDDILFLCSGKLNEFCLEDAVCAGMVIDQLGTGNPKARVELSDSARAAKILYQSSKKDLLKMLTESEHGKYLISIGMKDDLPICQQVDSIKILPVIQNGVVVKFE
jgi:2-phosphosulfolactate phosphatase